MVRGSQKSHSRRKVYTRTPGGNTVVRHIERKPGRAICAMTGQFLHGVANERQKKMQNTSKCKKRPQRAFGGVLSSAASRFVLKNQAREL